MRTASLNIRHWYLQNAHIQDGHTNKQNSYTQQKRHPLTHSFGAETNRCNGSWRAASRFIAPRTRSMSRNYTANRSTWGLCRRGSTAPCNSPPRRSRSGSCSARRRSSWWRWSVDRWPSRRSCPRRPNRCPTSKSARCRSLANYECRSEWWDFFRVRLVVRIPEAICILTEIFDVLLQVIVLFLRWYARQMHAMEATVLRGLVPVGLLAMRTVSMNVNWARAQTKQVSSGLYVIPFHEICTACAFQILWYVIPICVPY